MSAYISMTIVGKLPRKRNGSDEVTVPIRVLATPDDAAAEWLLHERYPSAEFVGVVTNAAVRYPAEITAKHLARTPLRRG